MKPRMLFGKHYVVPYALICAYGLFAVTKPPTLGDDNPLDTLPIVNRPAETAPVSLAEHPSDAKAAHAGRAATR